MKRRIMLGTYVLSAGYYDAYYGKAQAVRTLVCQDFDAAFNDVDLIVTPATPTPAFKLGEKSEDPLADVPFRYFYDLGQSGRIAGDCCALRLQSRGTSDRAATDRA